VTSHRLVAEQAEFDALCEELADAPRYAVDTEFHRERTYLPQVAVVQLAWDGQVAVVDALSVELEPLAAILQGSATAVLHAADQDLEVLGLSCGTIPARLFDTQVAAGFLGMSSVSLSSLCEQLIGRPLPKSDRLTDWLARPLTQSQLDYAAADVAHLFELHDVLLERLERLERVAWVEDECDELRVRARGPRDPDDAWQRIKEARSLRGQRLAVARAVAAWRERRAAALNQPTRFIMSDLAVVAIAERMPRNARELASVRGVDERLAKGERGAELLEVVRLGAEAAPPERTTDATRQLERRLRPAVTLASAWVSQLARDCDLDPALVATRADIEAFLRGDPDARLRHGWRADFAGEAIRQLVDGEAAVAFERDGTLALEQRSRQPLD
jgi:ribonuclease D